MILNQLSRYPNPLTYNSRKPREIGCADVAEWSSSFAKEEHNNASALRADSPSGDQEFESPHPRLTFFLRIRVAACTLPAGYAPTLSACQALQ